MGDGGLEVNLHNMLQECCQMRAEWDNALIWASQPGMELGLGSPLQCESGLFFRVMDMLEDWFTKEC